MNPGLAKAFSPRLFSPHFFWIKTATERTTGCLLFFIIIQSNASMARAKSCLPLLKTRASRWWMVQQTSQHQLQISVKYYLFDLYLNSPLEEFRFWDGSIPMELISKPGFRTLWCRSWPLICLTMFRVLWCQPSNSQSAQHCPEPYGVSSGRQYESK